MKSDVIKIRGARVHNLKNVSLDLPRNKFTVITGISGSGKSSLAFDTIYAEGQRRYVESLSAYARQFLGVMDKPEVERIEGISPAISIDQRKASHNPRSTVGTITEIYDYIRLLFARAGVPHCPVCGRRVSKQSIEQIEEQVLKLPDGKEILILGPVVKGKKGEHRGILEEIQRGGFVRVRIDGVIHRAEEALDLDLDRNKKHTIETVVDRMVLDKELDKERLVDSLEIASKMGKGIVVVSPEKKEDLVFSEYFACEKCGVSLPELEPRLFSFNSPYGACSECSGLGEKLEVDPDLVIPNKKLTLAEGAVRPWMRASHKLGRQSYFWNKLRELAGDKGFSIHEPVGNLSSKIVTAVLYGEEGFEGVIPNLERRYKETDSEWTRKEIEQYMIVKKCPACQGKRLKPEALAVTLGGKSIDHLVEIPVAEAKDFFSNLEKTKVSEPVIKEIINRTRFLIDVGLDYLSLGRKASTLAGGEEQRIRLATQIGSKLTGVLYILDEPSIGLHPRDQGRLIKTLKRLKDSGNTVVVVEHDPQTILAADWVIDIGPGAGKHGGKVVFEGTPKELRRSDNLTGQYLAGKKRVKIDPNILKEKLRKSGFALPKKKRQEYLIVKGAKEHNLKNINFKIPLGNFVCVTGVSGSGKSSLVDDVLAKALFKNFYKSKEEPGQFREITGLKNINKVVLVNQSPIGRTPRSNPATYTGCFSYIRELFSKTKEARVRGYDPGRFSFNVKGGRCEACEGQGEIKVEMFFLPDIYVECQECRGKRYNKEALKIEYRGKNIAEVLEMTVEEAMKFFKHIPGLFHKLKMLSEVGLSYIELGQPAPSLSGGEAQRIKLASELSKKGVGKTLYMLDEPTTGLHFEDIKKLIYVLKSLVAKGNTVLTIEHNLDFIKNADWICDLGPEGGEEGGEIIAEGPPSGIKKVKESHTGEFLKKQS